LITILNVEELAITEQIKVDEAPRTRVGQFFRAIQPILLRHHPLCEQFDSHTMTIVGKNVCIGCFAGIPAWIATIAAGFATGLFFILPPETLVMIGGILCLFLLFGKGPLSHNKKIKILTKVLVGAGMAFFVGAIWGSLGRTPAAAFWTFILLQVALALLNLQRGIAMYATCKRCEYAADWGTCPGMGVVTQALRAIHKKPND